MEMYLGELACHSVYDCTNDARSIENCSEAHKKCFIES